MVTELTMPQMGYDMQEGTVVRWLKAEGSNVELGEPVAEIETDKAVVEFESYASGSLLQILVPEGSTVPVGQAIAVVGEESAAPAPEPAAPAPEVVSPGSEVISPGPEVVSLGSEIISPGPEVVSTPEPEEEDAAAIPLGPSVEAVVESEPESAPEPEEAASEPESPPARIFATPIARQLASEAGIDLASVVGSGPGGRIVREDIERAAAGMAAAPVAVEPEVAEPVVEAEVVEPAAEVVVEAEVVEEPVVEAVAEAVVEAEAAVIEPEAEVEPAGGVVPLSRMRRQIARVTTRSKEEKPHFYVNVDVDMTEAMDLRVRINDALADQGVRVTVNDMIVAASVGALKKYPKFNAYYQDGGVMPNEDVNVGIAMALEEGLIMPAVVGAGDMSLAEIAEATKELAARANQGTLSPQEYAGGTFAISNMGMMNVSSFVAIIQPPQTAVLAVGSVQRRAVVTSDDRIVARQMMTATLSADHRIVDGAEGAQFVNEIRRALENPLSMVL